MDDTAGWRDVGAFDDVPQRGARRITHPTGDIAVFRSGDDRIFALRDRCPHKHGPLSQGIVHGHSVACPLHGRVIDLATGEFTGADKGQGCAPVIPVRVRAGRLLIPALV